MIYLFIVSIQLIRCVAFILTVFIEGDIVTIYTYND